MTQTFTPELCAHLSSLVPGFEGHWWWVKKQWDDVSDTVKCGEDIEWQNSELSIKYEKICPAWQAEDVLRNSHKLFGDKEMVVCKKIAWFFVAYQDTAYQKIEEYLWEILGHSRTEECTGAHCKCMQNDCANHHYNDHKK